MEWNVKNPLTEALKNNEDGEGADHGRGAGGERHDDASQRRELAEDAHNLRRNKHQWCLFGCLFGCISVCVMRINQHFETIFACHYSNHSTNFATMTMEREKTRPRLLPGKCYPENADQADHRDSGRVEHESEKAEGHHEKVDLVPPDEIPSQSLMIS